MVVRRFFGSFSRRIRQSRLLLPIQKLGRTATFVNKKKIPVVRKLGMVVASGTVVYTTADFNAYCRDCISAAGIPGKFTASVIPKRCMSSDDAAALVSKNPEYLRFIPTELKTQEMCDLATAANPTLIEFVPRDFRTQVMCNMAIIVDIKLVLYVPEKYMTDEFNILFVEQIVSKIKKKIFSPEDYMFLRYVSNKHKTEEFNIALIEEAISKIKEKNISGDQVEMVKLRTKTPEKHKSEQFRTSFIEEIISNVRSKTLSLEQVSMLMYIVPPKHTADITKIIHAFKEFQKLDWLPFLMCLPKRFKTYSALSECIGNESLTINHDSYKYDVDNIGLDRYVFLDLLTTGKLKNL